jgi:ankyrin repeat protein
MRQYIQPTLSLQAFQSLLPGEVSFEQHHHNLTLTATSLMLEPNFTQLLVFSVANGFAGLNQMPIAGVFKFFTRYGNLKTLFGQILQARSCHFAKSLAENFFKIAIEAQESDIITQLLDTRLVQVNDVVCLVNGQRLTAVGRAAQLRDLKTMKTMIRVGADVNKTYNPDSTRGGSLNLLIGGLERGETFPDAVQIIQTLLGAGAKFDVETLNDATRLRRHSNIALCLLLDLPPEYHMEMFARGTPSMITSHLEQEQAFEAIKHILEACNSHHKGQCLQTFENQVEWALVESARRGHVHVVRLLLPYSNRLTRLLSAAIRGGDRKVVDVILARNPGFDSPADSIERYHASNRTTPLAEAILTNKDDLIRLCETANALEHLHLEGHLQAALTAAATTGNSAYVEKLLQYGPEASDLSAALGFAILNSHEAISLRLITAGACFIDCPNGSDILFCALKQRNATLVRAILDRTDLVTGATYLTGKQNWFAEAVRWGDVSVMLDLHYTFPETRIKDAVYPESDTWENSKKFLYFLINLDLLDTSTFTQFLRTSILNGDEEMVYHLIELGAEPSDATCLSHAAGSQPAILRILLEHIPRSRKPRTKLGTFAVIDMIGRGVAGLESLEILLLSEIVDIRSFQFHHSPLGLAIKHAVYYRDSFPIVQRLLEAGCDPNGVVAVPGIGPGLEYYSNMTALLAAVSTHNIDLVRLLITFSAEVNTQASRGLARTPLQLAAELGCLEISQLLIKEGAQVNALPAHRGGGTALQLAAISGNCNIAAELLSHGADPEAPPSKFHGRWPIEGAAEHDRLDMVEYLLKVTVFNAERCRRAMELAQENGHMGCYDLILEHVQTQEGVEEMGTMGLAGFI